MSILDHVSHSQTDMWQKCPRQWEYRYVHGLKIPPSGALIEGRCYHETLEHNFKQKISTQVDLPVDDCLDIFSTVWDAVIMEEEVIKWEGRGPGFLKGEGIGLVKAYTTDVAPSIQPLRVEQTYVSDIGGVKFICIIDLEEASLAVIDHKTSAKRYTQDDVDKSLQASAAALVLDKGIVFYNHVAVKTRVPIIQIVKSYRTRADIEWYADMVTQVIMQMKTGIAPPRPTGWWCSERFCGYHEMCRGECARSYF